MNDYGVQKVRLLRADPPYLMGRHLCPKGSLKVGVGMRLLSSYVQRLEWWSDYDVAEVVPVSSDKVVDLGWKVLGGQLGNPVKLEMVCLVKRLPRVVPGMYSLLGREVKNGRLDPKGVMSRVHGLGLGDLDRHVLRFRMDDVWS